jgi:hypothetical protein
MELLLRSKMDYTDVVKPESFRVKWGLFGRRTLTIDEITKIFFYANQGFRDLVLSNTFSYRFARKSVRYEKHSYFQVGIQGGDWATSHWGDQYEFQGQLRADQSITLAVTNTQTDMYYGPNVHLFRKRRFNEKRYITYFDGSHNKVSYRYNFQAALEYLTSLLDELEKGTLDTSKYFLPPEIPKVIVSQKIIDADPLKPQRYYRTSP